MKTVLKALGLCVVALLAAGLLFREQAKEVAYSLLTSDMYVAADTDDFDPGLPIGATFPAIRAIYRGSEIDDVGQFIRDKGMIFIANRSVDW